MTLQLSAIGNNRTEIDFGGGTRVFFSYNTPVAAWIDGKPYRTEKKFSVTTSKHINQFFGDVKAELKPQSFFDNLTVNA